MSNMTRVTQNLSTINTTIRASISSAKVDTITKSGNKKQYTKKMEAYLLKSY
jgi:hypothetical protein